MIALTVVPLEEATIGPCACCGLTTQNLRGEVYAADVPRAAYYVRWTAERLDTYTEWLFDMGANRQVPREERSIVALRCRSHGQWPAFMVVDAMETSWGPSVASGGQPLAPDQVVGRPIGSEVYAMADQILLQDPRVGLLMRSMYATEPPRWKRWLGERLRMGRVQARCKNLHVKAVAPVT